MSEVNNNPNYIWEQLHSFELYGQSCNSRRRVDSCRSHIQSVDRKIANEIFF